MNISKKEDNKNKSNLFIRFNGLSLFCLTKLQKFNSIKSSKKLTLKKNFSDNNLKELLNYHNIFLCDCGEKKLDKNLFNYDNLKNIICDCDNSNNSNNLNNLNNIRIYKFTKGDNVLKYNIYINAFCLTTNNYSAYIYYRDNTIKIYLFINDNGYKNEFKIIINEKKSIVENITINQKDLIVDILEDCYNLIHTMLVKFKFN